MKLNFDYKGKKITYNLTYKKIRMISISVKDNKMVDVIAPIGTSVYTIMDKVKGNAEWIIDEIYGKDTNMPVEQIDTKETELFNQYTYLGKNYKLEVVPNAQSEKITVKMLRGKLVVEASEQSSQAIRKAIIEWYESKVSAKVKERMKTFKAEYEITPKNINIIQGQDAMVKIDDTCITVDVRIGIAPVEVMDYMITNELNRLNGLSKEASDSKIESLGLQVTRSEKWIEENKNRLIL